MLVLPYDLQQELKKANHVSLMLQKCDHRDHFFLAGRAERDSRARASRRCDVNQNSRFFEGFLSF